MDKKYLKQVALYVLTTLVSLGVMLYVGYHLFSGLTRKVETEPALLSTVSAAVEADMYIFRDETPLSSAASGSLVPAVSDGARVGVGDVVSRRYDVSAPDVVAQIASLETQIRVIEQMQNQGLSVGDTAAVDSEIYAALSDIAREGVLGEAENILSLRATLSAALNRRALLTGRSDDMETALASLRTQKSALTAQLGTCRAEITAAQSGYYYASCDGYERVFSAARALTMTAEEFVSLTHSQAETTESYAGKIALGYTWYAACLIPTEEADALAAGKSYSVSFPYNGGKTLTMELERCEESDAGVLLVFSSERLPEGFSFTRSQPATVLTTEYTGLKLPLAALRVVDGVSGVYILEGGIVRYRAVSVLAEGEDYFIADPAPTDEPPDGFTWLSRNDIVITKGRGLSEGRVLS